MDVFHRIASASWSSACLRSIKGVALATEMTLWRLSLADCMDDLRDRVTRTRNPRSGSIRAASALATLVTLGAIGSVLLFVNFLLTMIFWKSAVVLDGVVALVGLFVASRSSDTTWSFRVGALATTVMSLAAIVFFQEIWASHAQHDARLRGMIETLCEVDVPVDAQLGQCGGSITNTGNGNSCQYWARAVVRTSASMQSAISQLETQGFQETELDIWNEPMSDGMTYWRDDDPNTLRLSFMESWEPQDNDLRCM